MYGLIDEKFEVRVGQQVKTIGRYRRRAVFEVPPEEKQKIIIEEKVRRLSFWILLLQTIFLFPYCLFLGTHYDRYGLSPQLVEERPYIPKAILRYTTLTNPNFVCVKVNLIYRKQRLTEKTQCYKGEIRLTPCEGADMEIDFHERFSKEKLHDAFVMKIQSLTAWGILIFFMCLWLFFGKNLWGACGAWALIPFMSIWLLFALIFWATLSPKRKKQKDIIEILSSDAKKLC